MSNKPVPRWVTSWPEHYGIVGNVEVVPADDYRQLEDRVLEDSTLLAAIAHDLGAKDGDDTHAFIMRKIDELTKAARPEDGSRGDGEKQ